ncbi:MAG: CapA family protein [Candidatus Saccharibacteria bacterium]|nr:CapA family protein [Candidatus Saccharibacteria bacterium]
MVTRRRCKIALVCIIIFFLTFVGTIFGVQFATKTGIFYVPGEVIYAESLNDAEREVLAEIFTEEVKIDKDVTISASYYLEKPALNPGEFLYDILVPVTDFYGTETETDIAILNTASSSFTTVIDGEIERVGDDFISLSELDATKKLLTLDGKYYLDDFSGGAIFRVVKFESEKLETEILPLVSEEFTKTWPEKETVLTFAQTGVTALSRGMHTKLNQVGNAEYFAEHLAEYLSGFDLTHTSNEASFTSAANSKNICSDPRFIGTLTAIGLDIVELTGNHNLDCGDAAAKSTIDIYGENGILVVGGGKTATEAAKALEISEKGTRISMFAYNLSTGGSTYDNTPGANQYYEEKAAAEIKTAKERGDFVIVDVQYYECNAYDSKVEKTTCDYADSAAGDQVGFFRHLVDLGADIVVGTSAHQPQTFELYGNGAIYYGLGNLFFDQVWWPGTTRSLILAHYFYDGKLLQTKIVPTVYDDSMQTKLMDEEGAAWFLKRLVDARPEK